MTETMTKKLQEEDTAAERGKVIKDVIRLGSWQSEIKLKLNIQFPLHKLYDFFLSQVQFSVGCALRDFGRDNAVTERV